MSEVIRLMTAPLAREAAHRIYARLDTALTLQRGFDGIGYRDLASVVVLACQLDRLAMAAAQAEARWRAAGADPAEDEAAADASAEVTRLLLEAGYLPLPAPEPAEPVDG